MTIDDIRDAFRRIVAAEYETSVTVEDYLNPPQLTFSVKRHGIGHIKIVDAWRVANGDLTVRSIAARMTDEHRQCAEGISAPGTGHDP
jgi:hypothetical protein